MNTTRATGKNCQLEMVFPRSTDGRPTIYDFLWEQAGPLFQNLRAKTVRVYSRPVSIPSSRAQSHAFQLSKLAREKRFGIASQSPVTRDTFDATIPVDQLDHFVNAYNVLFDSHFSSLVFETPRAQIDFSKASDHTIVMQTRTEDEPIIRSFFARVTNAPRIRSFRFGANIPLQHALERSGTP